MIYSIILVTYFDRYIDYTIGAPRNQGKGFPRMGRTFPFGERIGIPAEAG
jgi:hypothetical protein